jgi:uncharacterized repeat protein (TIGR03809 family)
MHDSTTMPWRPEAFARKWLALAERRRTHLTELYESGAWKRYFTEETLRAHMREAVREVERWSAMVDDTAPAAPERREAPAASPRAA